MPPVGFEPIIPADQRPPTYALNRAATEIGDHLTYRRKPVVSFCDQLNQHIPVGAWSKVWLFGRSLARFAGKNTTVSMDICFL
jgi:hypothetical protein